MAAINATEKLKLKKFIKELKSHKAPHTEFVSVYVPKDYDIIKIIQHLAEEQGTASNIKSASTRKNVQNALEKMIQHLRNFKQTPENGLAVFCGNVAAGEGKQDIRIWSVEPPVPLKARIYRCDKNFLTDMLEEMLIDHMVYGLVVVDRRDATLALLKGKTIVPVKKTHSEVPGKFKAGGQCLDRHTEVLVEDDETVLLKNLKIGDTVISYDFDEEKLVESKIVDKWSVRKNLTYEIVTDDSSVNSSGDHLFFVDRDGVEEVPAEELKVGDLLIAQDGRRSKIIEINEEKGMIELIDISVEAENFIANGIVVHNSAQRFARIREGAYKDHFKKVAEHMKEQYLPLGNNLKGIIIGGPGTTVNNFLNKDYITGDLKRKIIGTKDLSYTGEIGLQELLDKSEDLLASEEIATEKKIMNDFFKQMQENMNKVTYGEAATLKALGMNAVDILLISEVVPDDKLEMLEEKAEQGGTTVHVISTETREGKQLQDLGGIAAILRFEVE